MMAVLVLQLRYVDRKDLGFKRDGILIVRNDIDRNQISSLKNELLTNPSVRGVATGFMPIMGEGGHFIRNETLSWEGKSSEVQVKMDWHFVDEDYQETYGLEMIQGRFFSKDFPSDRDNWVINESAVKAMGMKDPIGKVFKVGDRSGQIIGVIKDFHVGTLKAEILPMYFRYASGYFSIAVRIDVRNTAAAIEHIGTVVKKFDPGRPLEYSFLDDYLQRMYDGDRRNARLVSIFGVISVVIACLGLFGLISFMAEQRTKEIGIRKVLGASVIRIVRMMSVEFTVLVGIAVLIAWPLGYFFASRWLDEFAYRINLSWWIFGGAGFIVLVLTLSTMSFRAIRAARANPVDSLRYE
jgi:putative ABC transport system permease protein